MALFNPAAVKGVRFNAYDRAFIASFGSAAERQAALDEAVRLPVPVAEEVPRFTVRRFNSGEVSAAYYLSGAVSKVKPPTRTGPVVTTSFSEKSKSKIRRAVENSSQELVTFLTLTFSPWDLKPWEIARYASRLDGLSASGSVCFTRSGRSRQLALVPRASRKRRRVNVACPIVRQDYAKHRLKNLRSTLTMKVNRQIKYKLKELPESEHEAYTQAHKFRLIWTAELHANGNIHFHALTNKYWAKKYLAQVWPFGYTNIKKLKDAEHAARYMVKYISKDEKSEISGNRYNISQNLRQEAKPMIYAHENDEALEARKLLKLMKEAVESRGGRVIDSGFGAVLPRPRRSRPYRDEKTGTIKRTKGVGWMPGDKMSVNDAFLGALFPVLEAYRVNGPVPF